MDRVKFKALWGEKMVKNGQDHSVKGKREWGLAVLDRAKLSQSHSHGVGEPWGRGQAGTDKPRAVGCGKHQRENVPVGICLISGWGTEEIQTEISRSESRKGLRRTEHPSECGQHRRGQAVPGRQMETVWLSYKWS